MRILLGLSLGLAPLLLVALLWRRVRAARDILLARVLAVGAVAVVLAVGCQFVA